MDDSTLKTFRLYVKGTKTEIPLEPKFSRTVKQYSCVVGSDVAGLSVTAVCNEGDAFCQVQKPQPDGSVAIKEGNNVVEVKVDAVDKSFSVYVVQVYRPSASDASLKGLKGSLGLLFPDFHRTEKHYVLYVEPHLANITLSSLPMNPKSKIVCHSKGASLKVESQEITLPLLLGDTHVSIDVTSGDGKATEMYNVIVRRGKPGYRPKPLDESMVTKQDICSICNLVVFRPRSYEYSKPAEGEKECSHAFCLTCLELFGKRKLVEESVSSTTDNGDKKTVKYVDCPICTRSLWSNAPVRCPDEKLEKKLSSRTAECPFTRYGCKNAEGKGFALDTLGAHVVTCSFVPRECSECRKLGALDTMQNEGGVYKHKEACTTKCECGRRYINSEKAYHEAMCSNKTPTLKGVGQIKAKAWESNLVDKKKYPGDATAIVGKIQKDLLPKYLSALDAAIKASRESYGTNTSIMMDKSLLEEMTKMYATAISVYNDSKSLKAGGGNASEECGYHLGLGLMMEEALKLKEAFPSPTELNKKRKQCREDKVDDSFYQDEVNGLLALLGVSKTASEESKIKAIEQEYHRLLDAGQSDKAAEVQGLHEWAIKQLVKAGKSEDATGGNSAFLSGYGNVYDKYKDAVDIDPNSVDANFHLGRILLMRGQYEEAVQCLRKVVGSKPISNSARLLLGMGLLELSPPKTENVQEGLAYVKDEIQKYAALTWSRYTARANGADVKYGQSTLLSDRLFELTNVNFSNAWFSLSKGYFLQNNIAEAKEVLFDLLYLLPDEMKFVNRKTNLRVLMGSLLCNAKCKLLKLPHQTDSFGPVINMQQESVAENLLSFMEIVTGGEYATDKAVTTQKKYTIEVLAAKFPRDATILSTLGTTQLEEYDSLPENKDRIPLLLEAEKSFVAALAIEDPQYETQNDMTQPPSELSAQRWWKTYHTKLSSVMDYLEKKKAEAAAAMAAKAKATAGSSTKKNPAATTSTATPSKQPAKPATTAAKDTKKTATTETGAKAPAKPVAQPNAKAKEEKATPARAASAKPTATPAKASTTTTTAATKTAPGSKTTPAAKPVASAAKTATTKAPAAKAEKPAEKVQAEEPKPVVEPVQEQVIVPVVPAVPKPKNFSARIGLARVLARKLLLLETPNLNASANGSTVIKESKADIVANTRKWYQEAISLQPKYHDAYIELGSILEKSESIAAAADVYASFPFAEEATQDDLYLHGEVTRTFMKEKRFKDDRLLKSLIAEGRAMGIKTLQKYIDILDAAAAANVLMALYCGVNKKPMTDPEMVTFFKSKFWM